MQQIGLLSSGWSLGFVAACIFVGRVSSAVGHVRGFAGLAAVSASAALLLLPLDNQVVWIVLRVVIGFCFGGLSIIIESWLNDRSDSSRRGGLLAVYMTVGLLASLAGTLSAALVDPMAGFAYTLMVLALVLSIVPITLTRAPQPKPIRPFSIKLLAL
ncbi:MFS transporter [Lichenicoccus sp.]|uniref:MFS transporter n=1 Tax=Lichenicoccus sp. TaxID=2781899 RepID=UPI003D107635